MTNSASTTQLEEEAKELIITKLSTSAAGGEAIGKSVLSDGIVNN